jgi:hypothetical protein
MTEPDITETQVFHWRGFWQYVPWEMWSRFRGLHGDGWTPLPGVGAGEHYFVVCATGNGRLFNIHPHRYLIDRDGKIVDDGYFGVLTAGEIERYEALDKRHYEYPQAHPLNAQEQQDFEQLRWRVWRSRVAPAAAMRELTRVAVALPDEGDAAWNVLEACGLSRAAR